MTSAVSTIHYNLISHFLYLLVQRGRVRALLLLYSFLYSCFCHSLKILWQSKLTDACNKDVNIIEEN